MSMNPKSLENLQVPSSSRAKELGAKGGKAKAAAEKIRKTFRELDLECTTDEEIKKILDRVKKMAMHGNLQAVKTYLEMTGMDREITASVIEEEFEDDGLMAAIIGKTTELFIAGDDSSMLGTEENNDGLARFIMDNDTSVSNKLVTNVLEKPYK